MMSSSNQKTTGSASQTLNFKKSPASLAYQAIRKCLTCDLLWSQDDLTANHVISQNNLSIVSQIQQFECNVFSLKIYDSANLHDPIYMALKPYEFTDKWFEQLYKHLFVYNTTFLYGPQQFAISLHFYEKLHSSGVLRLFCRCQDVKQLKTLLLLLAGDVEQNPGPSYKDLCKDSYKKKNISRQIKQNRQTLADLRQLRKQTNDDFTYLKDIEKRECDLQIGALLGSAASIAGQAYTGYKALGTMNKIQNVAEVLSEQISSTLDQFRECFRNVTNYVSGAFTLFDLVKDIMMGLLQISFAKPGYKLASLGVELFRLLPKYGIPTSLVDSIRTFVYPYFNSKRDAIEPIPTISAAVSKQQVELQMDTSDLLSLAGEITPTQIVMFLLTILSAVFLKAIPKTSQLESILKRVGDICRSGKNIVDFNSTMHSCLTTGLDLFKTEVLGILPHQEIEQFISGIRTWFEDVEGMLKREDEWKKSDQILRDPHVIIEVENLYKRGLEFSREISDKKIQRELQLPFQTHMRMLSDLMKMVDTSGAFGTRPRTQPVVIWLFGESGVGKSGMSWPLAVDLNNMFVPNAQEAKEFSKNIYMRNVEQEFWDNYQGQNVVIYDDFGQRVDSTSKPNEEFMELIRTANIAPYPLHMAHLEDKRKTRFTSKVLLLTSNVFEQSVNSLTFPDAFRRRIDLCARITNKDEFTKAGYSSSKGEAVQRLDKKKVMLATGEIISTEVYEIELVDPESGAVLESALSYEEFLERCQAAATDAFDSSRQMNDFLERYAERRFNQQATSLRRSKEVKKEEVTLQILHVYGDGDEAFKDAKSKFTTVQEDTTYTVHSLKGLSMEEIRQKVAEGSIYMIDGMHMTPESFELEIQNFYLNQYEDEGEELDLKKMELCACEYLFQERRTRKESKLKKLRDFAMAKLTDWKDRMITFAKEHPFILASSIIGTISALFLAARFWTKIVSKPETTKKLMKADLCGVEVLPYDDKTPVKDLSQFNQSQLISILPTVLSEMAFSSGCALLFRQPYPLVIGMISGLKKGIKIFIRNKIFNWHGQKYELIDPSVQAAFERSAAFNVLEANVSGDSVTLAKPKISLEAHCSADAVTQAKPKVVLEAFASSDAKTLAKPAIRLESNVPLDVDMQIWKDQVAQNLIGHAIFSNMYKICKVLKNDEMLPLVNGIFVRGRTMLVPGHLSGFLTDDDTIEITNAFNPKFRMPWKDIVKQPVLDSRGDRKEAALLGFPAYVNAHKDLVKHFSDSHSMGQYKRAEVCVPTYRYSDKFKALLMTILGNFEAAALDEPIILEDRATKFTTYLRKGLVYTAPTMQGDCGAPVIINETQVLRKIAGIHVAGKAGGKCLAESITQADLERTLTKLDVEFQIQVDFDNFVKLPNYELPQGEEFDPKDFTYSDMPSDKFLPVGKVAQVPYEPGKTDLRPSLIHDKLGVPRTKPAKLRNEFVNGVEMKIKHLNLKKCAMDTPYIQPDLIERAYQLVKEKWLSGRRSELARVLTWEESIIGNSESEYISSINRQSSPGYPWIFKREKGKPGKTGWFGNDEYILNEEVKEAVDHRIAQAKLGKRVPTVWIDTLKDERRPIEKVNAFKTRVFSNGPMDYSIAFRQYFLGFIAHLMENRIDNEVSIGTNVYSSDWAKTAKKLKSKGKKVIAGDFSTFDGTLNSCLMAKFVDLANEFYDDGPENALIRKVLFTDVYNSVHLCDGTVYMMTHSQPSGNPATTPLNCFINSMGLRITFDICAKMAHQRYSMLDFNKHVSIVSYGDDNVVNFSDEVAPWFNMDTITEAFAQIGFIYTDETKSERGTAPLWRDLSEVAYLKRNFRFDEERQVWEAPLSMDTITEMPLWCRGGLDLLEGTKVTCENAIMELSMHDQPTFEKWTKKISNAFYQATGQQLSVDTYRGYAESRYFEYYL